MEKYKVTEQPASASKVSNDANVVHTPQVTSSSHSSACDNFCCCLDATIDCVRCVQCLHDLVRCIAVLAVCCK